jgi:sterol 14-demethylase
MDFPSINTLWCGAMALLFIIIVLSTKRSVIHRGNPSQLPPLVNGIAFLALLPNLLKKGLHDVVNDLYVKHGSVFMAGLFGPNVTFLIGPEVTAHFYQAPESEISIDNLYEFTVPIFGKGVLYDVDLATRSRQIRFCTDAIQPMKLKNHVDSLVHEVQVKLIFIMFTLTATIIVYCKYTLNNGFTK